jgi:hypothetical protein
MNKNTLPDAIILIKRLHTRFQTNIRSPLFVCSEMFIDLENIEEKRWQLWALRSELQKRGHAVATLADFLEAEDIGWLEGQGAQVAQKWYLDDAGQDLTLYRGVSLGRCIEYDVKARAIRLLKLVRCIERVCKRYPGVQICTDFAPDSLELTVIKGLGIDVCAVEDEQADQPPLQPPAQTSLSKMRVSKFARSAGLMALRLISRLTFRRQSIGTPRIIVRVGLQSSLMLESWLKNPSPGIHFVLWMDYLMRPISVLRLVLAGHSITAPQLLPASSEVLSPLHLVLKQHLKSPDRHSWAGPSVSLLLDNILDQKSTKSFPFVRAAIDDAYAELSRTNRALLVIPNDCQLLMRAWTLVSKSLGQSSLVLQHGHLDYFQDGDHHTATHSAFWSDMVAQEFMNAGLRSEQILVTGSPNADQYIKYRHPPTKSHFKSMHHRPRILIITTGNPGVQAYVHETWVCDYVAGILDALMPRFDDFHIALKLHPGEIAGLYREFLADRLPSSMKISDRGNLEKMIAEADIIISPPSTVVIEAQACGKAVILMPLPTLEDRMTTLTEASDVITLQRNEDLVPTIDAILSRAPDLSLGKWPLEQFLGPLDGASSRRLLNAVLALAIESSETSKVELHTSLEKSHAVR